MRKHRWQQHFRNLSILAVSVVGTTLVYGESAAPIPGFPEDLTLRAARAAHAPAEPLSIPVEEVPAYVAWRENVRHFASVRVAYDYERWFTAEYHSARKQYPNLSDQEFVSGTKVHGSIRISRSGGTLDQNAGSQRFEIDTPPRPETFPWVEREPVSYTRIHSESAYYFFYPARKSGAIWKEWSREDRYPILEVLPPDPKNSRLTDVDEAGTVLDFRTDDTTLIRYHLDPEHGMMPTRIEHYEDRKDDGLFLYHLNTVEAYSQTEEGIYVPSKCTTHNCFRHRDDGSIEDILLSTYTLTSFEEVEKFAPEEFVFTFPEGTRVTNHIAGVESVVGAPGK